VGLVILGVATMVRAGVWGDELKLWEDAWKKGPHKSRTNKNYGFVLTQNGRVAEGIERLKYANELEPDNQDFRITFGAAYLQAQDWEKALEQFEKAVELRPDKEDGWNNMGVALFQLERFDEAKVAFERALENNESYFMALLGLGGTETMLGDIEASVELLEKAIALQPADPRAVGNLVTTYIRAEQWQKALETLDRLDRLAINYQGADQKRAAIEEKLKE